MLERLIGEDIKLVIVPGGRIGAVKADRGQIERVILNLAVNAREAMPQGGTITIETADVELEGENLALTRGIIPGPYVMLKVTDTGCGMDAELQSHIFEPFFTTKSQGTGLGLATVYGVIRQMGGDISVESELGKGTSFTIYLPRISETVGLVNEAEPAGKIGEEHRTVLLVEDERALRKLTGRMLLEMGFVVLEAENGRQAIEIAERADTAIDLLLTDVVMPGMSGWELAKRLLAERPEMKALYMSGYTDGVIAEHGAEEAAVSILRKPFTRDELARHVGETVIGVAG